LADRYLASEYPHLVEGQPISDLGKNPNLAARFVPLHTLLAMESGDSLPSPSISANMLCRLRRREHRGTAREIDADDDADVTGGPALEALNKPLSPDVDTDRLQSTPAASKAHPAVLV
jgi:hypothetical protein